ncbi:MAG: MFS transporter [Symbiobacteriia bacterium]
MAESKARGLWNRDFTVLMSGLLISYVGDAFFAIGFIWLALNLTGDPRVVGVVMALEGLVVLAVGPVAGALVDAWNKRWIMILADGVRGIIVLLVYLLFRAGTLTVPVLYLSVVLLALCDSLYKPSLRILVPTLVGNESLPAANSFIQASQQFALIIGAGVAGVVVTTFGTSVTLIIDAASFFISALALVLVRFAAQLVQARRATAASMARDTWEGLRFSFGQPNLLSFMVLSFSLNLVLSPANVILPIFSRDTLGAGAQGFGLLGAAIALGMVLGSVVAGMTGHRLAPWTAIGLGLAVLTGSMLSLSLVGGIVSALLIIALMGAAAASIQVPMVTQIQREVPPQLMGRTFSSFSSVSLAANPIGAALAGFALKSLAPPLVFRVAGFGLLGVSLVVFIYRFYVARKLPAALAGAAE